MLTVCFVVFLYFLNKDEIISEDCVFNMSLGKLFWSHSSWIDRIKRKRKMFFFLIVVIRENDSVQ